MSIKGVCKSFASNTSFAGMPRIVNASTRVHRFLWIFLCLAALSIFVTELCLVVQRYMSYPKSTTVEVRREPVYFPAISLCNMRNLDPFILNTLNRMFKNDPLPKNHIGTSGDPFIEAYLKTVARFGPLWYEYQDKYHIMLTEAMSRTSLYANVPTEILQGASTKLEEFIVSCKLGSRKCNRTAEFSSFINSQYFNCFTFQVDTENEKPQYQPEGVQNGWSSIVHSGNGIVDKNEHLSLMPGLHETDSKVTGSEGARVVLHPPGTQPCPLFEGFDVPPGFSASMGVHLKRVKRLGQPYGHCSQDYEQAKNMSSLWQYRRMSCQNLALQLSINDECGCKDLTLVDLPNTNLPACRDSSHFPDECMHHATNSCLELLFELHAKVECTKQIRQKAFADSTFFDTCKCFPPCDETSYDISFSLAKWPASGLEGDAAYMDIFYIENFHSRFNNSFKNDTNKYFSWENREVVMQDFSRINVYIANSDTTVTEEKPDYPLTQMISDVGGQLGLWLGISIISAAEVLELLFDMAKYALKGKEPKQKNQLGETYI